MILNLNCLALKPMTAEALNINDFLIESKNELVIDVRAPIEFFKGHAVGAINIPLFENSERAEIGTLYKLKGKEDAVTRGLEIVSPKMVPFVNKVKELSKNKKAFIYCARGGMRSNSFAWLMNTSGVKSKILEGGYKTYRNYVIDYFANGREIILIGGKTGSAKTEVLKELKKLYYPVIDLENIAHHKGSAFGSINEEKQHPQQLFENNLFAEFTKIDGNIYIVEDESQTIGYNKIPHPLWLQMKKGTIIKLNIPFELRVQKLVDDYTTTNVEALKSCVFKIAQQLGSLNTKLCIEYLDKGDLAEVARLSLFYYDRAYEYKYQSKMEQTVVVINSDTIDAEVNAQKVKVVIDSLK